MRRLRVFTPQLTVLFTALFILSIGSISFFTLPAFADPATNDDLADATVINPAALPFINEVDVTAANFTNEPGEDNDVSCIETLGSLWWSFTPTVSTNYIFDTAGSNLTGGNDTNLVIYEGTSYPLDDSNEVYCNDDYMGNALAFAEVPLIAGTSYLIRVADLNNGGSLDTGSIRLTVSFPDALNDDLADANVIDPNSLPFIEAVTVSASNFTTESGELLDYPACAETLGSLWWRFTPTLTAAYRITTNGSSTSPSTDTTLFVYDAPSGGGQPTAADGVGCDDESGDGSNASLNVPLTAGTTYLIRAADFNDGGSLDTGTIQLNLAFAPPANDDLANAVTVDPGSLPYESAVVIAGATIESGEPAVLDCSTPGGVPTGGSLWWGFTPTAAGTYLIDTVGSTDPAGDTVLSIHTGTGHPLTEAACSDDYVFGTSVIEIALDAGTTYFIRVANYNITPTTGGVVHLRVKAAVSNDDLANSIAVSPAAFPYSDIVNNTGATTEPLEDNLTDCAGNTTASLWWSFTPAVSASYQINTRGTQPPANTTVIGVFTGSSATHPLTEEDCDTGSAIDGNSQVTMMLDAGTTYYIRVSQPDDGTPNDGFVFLTVQPTPALNDNLAAPSVIGPTLPFTESITVFPSNVSLEFAENTYTTCSGQVDGTLWWAFTPGSTDRYQFDTIGSTVSSTIITIETGNLHPTYENICDNNGSVSQVIAELLEGVTYFIRVAQPAGALGTGSIVLNANVAPGPANDNIASAFTVTGVPFSGTSFLIGSTIEIDELTSTGCTGDSTGSVWWVFTPATTNLYTIDTVGSTLTDNDTVLSIYDFDTVHPLNELNCNDDIDSDNDNYLSSITIELDSGVTYLIRVAEYGDSTDPNSSGTVRLNVFAQGAPPNDNLEDAFPVTSLPFNGSVDLAGSTIEVNEQVSACDDTGDSSVWWSFSPPATGSYRIDTAGSDSANDTVLSIFTDGSTPGTHPLVEFACNDDVSTGLTSSITDTFTVGTTYYIRISAFDPVQPGIVRLNVTDLSAPPPNDDLANAITVTLSPDMTYQTFATTTGMTEEIGDDETYPGCAPTEGSLWWRFTPPVTGEYAIATGSLTFGPQPNTVISIYTESSPGAGAIYPITEIDCNDEFPSEPSVAGVVLELTAGTEYFIRVADFDEDPANTPDGLDVGDIFLVIAGTPPFDPPPNDDFINAAVLPSSSLPHSVTGFDITDATIEVDEEFATCGEFEEGSVWWTFTPEDDGYYQFDTYDTISEYENDTLLTIYSGTELTDLTEIACNDDNNPAGNDYNAFVQPYLTALTTYYVRVGIYACECEGIPYGQINLNVSYLGDIADNVVSLSYTATSVAEGSYLNIDVVRTGTLTNALTVDLAIDIFSDFNSTEGDFTITGASYSGGVISITIPEEWDRATFQFNANNEPDGFAEPDNTFYIEVIYLPGVSEYTVDDPSSVELMIMYNGIGVTHGDDDPSFTEGTLRQALANNAAYGGGSTITLPSGVYFSVEDPLVINETVTIAGNNSQTVAPCGCLGGQEIFTINGGSVHLYGFTITGGISRAMVVNGGMVRLGNDPLIITGNSSTVCGGGLYIGPGGNVTIEAGSQITNNYTTANGGGICVVDGILLVQGATTISGNTANGSGGGIYQSGMASVTITAQTNINSNFATDGGGIYQEGGSLSVSSSLIQSNTATSGVGGAIRFSADNTRSITSSCIVANNNTAVTYAGGTGVVATGNWWGSASGPFSNNDLPNPPNDANTLTSIGDSVTWSGDPPAMDYSGYLGAPHLPGCMVCIGPSSNGDARYCDLP